MHMKTSLVIKEMQIKTTYETSLYIMMVVTTEKKAENRYWEDLKKLNATHY